VTGPEIAVSSPVILGVCDDEMAYLEAPADASLLLDDEGIVRLVSFLPPKSGSKCAGFETLGCLRYLTTMKGNCEKKSKEAEMWSEMEDWLSIRRKFSEKVASSAWYPTLQREQEPGVCNEHTKFGRAPSGHKRSESLIFLEMTPTP
jgi:hypothetical protein